QIDGIEREIDFLHVAPVELILDFRAGQENIPDAHVHFGPRDGYDLLLRLVPIARLALLEFTDDAPEHLERLHIIGLPVRTAVVQGNEATLALHPFGIIIARVVIPTGALAAAEGAFEFRGHTRALAFA